jgi:hypothetical protein
MSIVWVRKLKKRLSFYLKQVMRGKGLKYSTRAK